MPELYPLTFEPVFKHYIWGGRNLARLGRQLPGDGRAVAESWEVSAHPNGATPVKHGRYRGQTLNELIDTLGIDLLGSRSATALESGQFPLLVKLLDCNRPLSVQVHPTADYARQQGPPTAPKSEMWYMLYAEPGARVVYGLQAGVTRERFEAALYNDALREVLHFLAVQTGEAIMVPSGSLHALLAGLLVVEIQQSADTTYRVYDWGRMGANGRPRELHVEQALAVIDFDQIAPGPFRPQPLTTAPARAVISTCEHFTVERLTLDPGERFNARCAGRSFEIWVCIAGQATLTWAGPSLDLPAVQTCLLPAGLGDFGLHAMQPTSLLRVYVP